VIHAVSLAAPQVQAGSLVVVVHDLLWRTNPEAYPSRGRRWHEAALGRALRRARRLVVPSDEVATQLIGAGADPGRVVTVAPGCDHLPPPDLRGAERLLHQLGVPGDFLLSVGTLEPRKNLPRLLAAYAAVRTRLPGPLVVVGPTGWGSDLDLGHAEGVVPAGRVEAPILAALYAKARLLAYVPLAEGFGLPPVEAMWAGIPVVASALPSTGGAAFEVDPLDVDAIAAGLETVAGDEELRDRLVRAGRDHTTGLTWEAAARRHLDLWAAI
jgi:glycosyltransferase involved in cell wall biosynthesis